jgi:[ribosomal protein S5]-alanine N-acetyltransferase
MRPFTTLTTERFSLRQLTLEDANEIFLLRSDERVNKYLDRPIAKNSDDAKQFINRINHDISNNELFYWAIAFKNNPKLIGTICLWNISEDETTAEIGFELLPEHQGKGIMQEVLPVVIKYGFEEMKLQSIDGEASPNNLKSIRLMKKFGFSFKNHSEKTAIYSISKQSKKIR